MRHIWIKLDIKRSRKKIQKLLQRTRCQNRQNARNKKLLNLLKALIRKSFFVACIQMKKVFSDEPEKVFQSFLLLNVTSHRSVPDIFSCAAHKTLWKLSSQTEHIKHKLVTEKSLHWRISCSRDNRDATDLSPGTTTQKAVRFVEYVLQSASGQD